MFFPYKQFPRFFCCFSKPFLPCHFSFLGKMSVFLRGRSLFLSSSTLLSSFSPTPPHLRPPSTNFTSFFQKRGATTTTPKKVKEFEEIPSPLSMPESGGTLYHFHDIEKRVGFLEAVQAYYKEFGPVVASDFCGDKEVWLFNPQHVEEFIKSEGKCPHIPTDSYKPLQDVMERANVSSPFFENSDRWEFYRRTLAQDLYSEEAVSVYLSKMNEAAKEASHSANLATSKVPHFLATATVDMMLYCFLGFNPHLSHAYANDKAVASPDDQKFITHLISVGHYVSRLSRDPHYQSLEDESPKFIEAYNRYLRRCRKLSRKMGAKLERMRVPPSTPLSSQAPLLTRLLHKKTLDDKEVGEQLSHLLLAGVEPTRHMLSWMLVHLGSDRQIQQKLRDELNEVLGDSPLSISARPQLPYLKACIREAYRMTPVSAFTTYRMTEKDTVIGGYKIPANTKIAFAMNAIQNDPSIVDQPKEFRPERWLEEGVKEREGTKKEILDHPFLADGFGYGGRKCLGVHFGELLIETFVSHLVRDWEFVKASEVYDASLPLQTSQKLWLSSSPYPNILFRKAKEKSK